MKRNVLKSLALALSISTLINSISAFAYDVDEHGNSIETIEYQNDKDEDFIPSTNVFAKIGSEYKVTIPKYIVLNGFEKQANYKVRVEGDIAGYETINVVPDDSFYLHTKNKTDSLALVEQDKITWTYSDFDADALGLVQAPEITAGKWNGIFYFNMDLDSKDNENTNVGKSILDDIILPDRLDNTKYRLALSKLRAPGIYNEKAELLASYDELEKEGFDIEADNGEAANVINSKYQDTSYVVLPDTINSIGVNALKNTNVEYVYIPESVSMIDDYAFADTKIVSATIPENVTFVSNTAFENTPAITESLNYDESNDSNKSNKSNPSNLIIRTINIDLENKNEVTINLERGYRYQIKAILGYYNNVTKQSTITVDDESIVRFEPDCYIDALEIGDTVIRGTYTTKKGNQKNAKINVHVKHTHKRSEVVIENRIEPTCASEGSYENVYYCITCGEEVARYKVRIRKLKPHVADEPIIKIIKEATCLEKGNYIETIYCINCGNKISELNKKSDELGHNFVNDICTRCGRERNYDAGAYDENWNMIYSWDQLQDLGFDVQGDASKNYYAPAMNKTIGNNKGIKYVIIPDGVTHIGNNAFSGMDKIKSIKLPSSVTNIGYAAFSGCRNLESITLPDSLNTIGENAFMNCKLLTEVTIPNSVTIIKSQAFYGCSSLKSVKISESIKTIYYETFRGCTSLTYVEIPDSVTNINEAAFKNCTSLETLIIGSSVRSIVAFGGSSAIKSVTFKNAPSVWKFNGKIYTMGTDPEENAQIFKQYLKSRLNLKE